MKESTIKEFHAACSVYALMLNRRLEEEKVLYTKDAYAALEDAFIEYRRRVIPNNKLKMNGEPMRRKGGIKNGKRKYRRR